VPNFTDELFMRDIATHARRAHPRTAPGAPASGPAGVEFSQKRAGSEIGAPLLPSESGAVCGCALPVRAPHFEIIGARPFWFALGLMPTVEDFLLLDGLFLDAHQGQARLWQGA